MPEPPSDGKPIFCDMEHMMKPDDHSESDGSNAAEARRIITQLGLGPHPEGGWYRRTWARSGEWDARPAATAILFLLEAGQSSAWHRVDADEIWFWHAGAPIELRILDETMPPGRQVRLGPDVLEGQSPQECVPAGHWQAAAAGAGYGLVSCVVVPGFRFSGFTLADAVEIARLDALAAG